MILPFANRRPRPGSGKVMWRLLQDQEAQGARQG
jgi:hypothetical protein